MQENNIYILDPESIKFDGRFVIFNPLQEKLDYEATKAHITKLGQLDHILMLNGKCIDGRHRIRIAKELGIPVRHIDVDLNTKEEDIIVICNKGTMSGRDYDNNQKAIRALKLVNMFKMKVMDAAKFMKVGRILVSYAGTIKWFGREDLLEILIQYKKNKIQLTNAKEPSRSLEIIAKYVKTEAESMSIIVNDDERIKWKPDAFIKTELGKAWYYEQMEVLKNYTDSSELLEVVGRNYAELVNFRYKTPE